MTPEELYSQNEPLVRWTMKKYYCDFIDDEDLMQEGRIGLWRAFGDNRDYYEVFAKWVGKYEYQQKRKGKK